jgi:chromosome segregation ATPase
VLKIARKVKMYNLKDVKKGLEYLSNCSGYSKEYNAISDYIHDLENNDSYLEQERNDLKDKLSRRNLQIKDLKKQNQSLESLKMKLQVILRADSREYTEKLSDIDLLLKGYSL